VSDAAARLEALLRQVLQIMIEIHELRCDVPQLPRSVSPENHMHRNSSTRELLNCW